MQQQYAVMAETLTQIADAIRNKTASSDQILAGAFAAKIADVPTYITVQSEAELPENVTDGTIAVVIDN